MFRCLIKDSRQPYLFLKFSHVTCLACGFSIILENFNFYNGLQIYVSNDLLYGHFFAGSCWICQTGFWQYWHPCALACQWTRGKRNCHIEPCMNFYIFYITMSILIGQQTPFGNIKKRISCSYICIQLLVCFFTQAFPSNYESGYGFFLVQSGSIFSYISNFFRHANMI